MTEKASGTFDITAWDEYATDERPGGLSLGRVRVSKTFHGDLTGTSETELQTVVTSAGPAAYVGVELFEGTLHGRKGTFVLQHGAGGDETGGPWLRWEIVPSSGTGELTGLRGQGNIVVAEDGSHSYTLDHELS
ncbi:DUF3224 domain-containing protein [Thermomonospora umbrina]|uniref:Uncharacterized protein DUF3224 n=1 Tax=Thermomonospora umbrina TaxID=111806 RepID=A0A3D9SRP7_9ACTN|nr:DUF3224 domain-containing protein [Thermomonospora umbrina]REE98602.1 uncharacterized protein DUF3224 [Thermomonospora umbrina]